MLKRPSPRAEAITYFVFLAVIVGLFGAEVARDYQPVKLGGLFCVLLWFPLILIHEAGHAAVGWLFGCYIDTISVGYGRRVLSFQWGRVPVHIHAVPIEGFVRFHAGRKGMSRIASALVYFAGPGAELLLAGIVVLAVGPSVVFRASDNVAVIAAQSVCICAALSATFNLIPHMSGGGINSDGDGRTPSPNDGLGILRALFGKRG